MMSFAKTVVAKLMPKFFEQDALWNNLEYLKAQLQLGFLMLDNLDGLATEADDPSSHMTQCLAEEYFNQCQVMWNAYERNKNAR